jgi:hypothetical protein
MKTITIILIVGFVSTLFSCKKADNEAPAISNVKVNNSTNTIDFHPGESFILTGLLTDNQELSQLKIDIHHDFDGHSHKSSTIRFSKIIITDISGESYSVEETIEITENSSSGFYHGTITAVDKAGNQSLNELFYFNIVREEQPTINLILPTSVTAGSQFGFTGIVTSPVVLSHIFLDVTSKQTGNTLLKETFSIESNQSTTWNPETDATISINVPSGTTGNLKFRLRAQDVNGNNTIFENEITVN